VRAVAILGTLIVVVFYLNLKLSSLDEHYRDIIDFGYKLAVSLLLLAASLGLWWAVAQRGQALATTPVTCATSRRLHASTHDRLGSSPTTGE
jgi:hypothetical protein